MSAFIPMPKIPRWQNKDQIIITEKIDGTNASIHINDDCSDLRIASRNRWITPDSDNYGFAAWVTENKETLLTLGPGSHFGEWWGSGIQRGYGTKETTFSLFNTLRWAAPEQQERLCATPVSVVPILYQGDASGTTIDDTLDALQASGSWASPGWQQPEGIVIYYPRTRSLYKLTYDNRHKGEV